MCSRLAIFFKLIVEVAIDPYCLLAGIPQYSETVGQEESPSAYCEGAHSLSLYGLL